MRRFATLLASGALAASALMAVAAGCDSFASSSNDESDARDETAAAPETGTADADAGVALEAASLTPIYARDFGSADDAGDAGAGIAPAAMVVDPSGGVALVGSYAYAAVDLGGATLPMPSGSDAFLLRLDGVGAHVASKAFGASADQFGAALAGSSDKLYASFAVDGTVVFGGSDSMTSAGVAGKFNSATVRFSGAAVSSGRTSFSSSANALVKGAALGAADSVLSFGDWEEGLSVNGTSTVTRVPGKTGLFAVRSFILGGVPQQQSNTTLCDEGASCIASAIASNPQTGESVVGGRYNGHIPGVDGGAGITTGLTDNDAYLMKLDADVSLQWLLSLRGSGAEEVLAVTAIPGTADFVAAGTFSGSLEVPGSGTMSSQGVTDIFVVRVDGIGKVVWGRAFGGAGEDRVRAITADASGNIFLTGRFKGPTLGFGSSTLKNADVGGLGTKDVFVAWLDGSGNPVYSARFGDGADEDATAIGLDAAGNVVVAGSFTSTIAFGATTLTARGRTDMFVAKLHR